MAEREGTSSRRGRRSPQESSVDPAAQAMLAFADEIGASTAFSRADAMAPCNIGGAGMCCKHCGMGPCRLTKDGQTGVCGATIDTIQARNFIRSDRGRGGGALRSRPRHGVHCSRRWPTAKPRATPSATWPSCAPWRPCTALPIEGRSPEEIANDLADLYIAQFGQQRGEVAPIRRAPQKRQEAVGRTGRHPARHRPRSGRSPAPHPHRRRPGRRAHPAPRHAHRPGRRLGRLDDRHRHLRHPVRHARAHPGTGQPGRAEGRHGQRRRPRPRADPERDDRGRHRRTRRSSSTPRPRAPRASTWPASAAPPTRS